MLIPRPHWDSAERQIWLQHSLKRDFDVNTWNAKNPKNLFKFQTEFFIEFEFSDIFNQSSKFTDA